MCRLERPLLEILHGPLTVPFCEMAMDPIKQFELEIESNLSRLSQAGALRDLSQQWLLETLPFRYSYNFSWLGRPIIQYPQDIVAIQELIWRIKPDLIIETGIAHGGSLILSASVLALIAYCEAAAAGQKLGPGSSPRQVLGIDIDIRPHNRIAIEAHPLSSLIQMIQVSSVAPDIIERVYREAHKRRRVMVLLDSYHSAEHVLL